MILSVVMITYNHELYISDAITGVLSQLPEFEFELIIADDCSTDNTSAIISKIIAEHPKSHIIKFTRHQTNKGMVPNLNWALNQCKGKYIALCEGDDYWTDPNKLQKQVDFLESNLEYSMCFHEVNLRKESENRLVGKCSNLNKFDFVTEDFFNLQFIATCSILFRTSSLNNFTIPERIASADRLLVLMLSLNGKIKFLDECMGVYRLHVGGISNTHIGMKKVYDISTLLNYFDSYTNFKYHDLCCSSLFYEIDTHLGPIYKSKPPISKFSSKEIIYELIKRLKYKIINKLSFKQ